MIASTQALSARDLGDWLTRAGPALATRRISAVHGRGPRLVADGATWISLSSPWGCGRLVRAADGSSQSTAHRYSDGATVIESRSTTTTEEQLERLIDSLQGPQQIIR
jgi:hypothetical protein